MPLCTEISAVVKTYRREHSRGGAALCVSAYRRLRSGSAVHGPAFLHRYSETRSHATA